MERGRCRRPGRGATDKHERFVRVIDQGVSNAEACRVVGINRRTGTRWRYGRTVRNTGGQPVHYPPVRTPSPPRARHPRYLSMQERRVIADLHREKKTLREIAAVTRRSPSTVSRELGRNTGPDGALPARHGRPAGGRVRRPTSPTSADCRRGAAHGRGGAAGKAVEP